MWAGNCPQKGKDTMATPRSEQTQELWAHELATLDLWIARLTSEANSYTNMAKDCQAYAPELVQGYLDWACWTNDRKVRAQERRQQIRDYLDGNIGPWW